MGFLRTDIDSAETEEEKHTISATDSHNNSVTANFVTVYKPSKSAPQLIAPSQGDVLRIFNSIGSVLGGSFKYLT